MIRSPGAADLLGLAGQIHVRPRAPRNHQRGIPKRKPFFTLDHFRRELDLEFPQRLHLLLREAANAASHLELGGEIAPEYDPRAAALARSELAHHRLAAADGEVGPKLFAALTLPGEAEQVAGHLRLQPRRLFISAQIAGKRGSETRGQSKNQRQRQSNTKSFHRRKPHGSTL